MIEYTTCTKCGVEVALNDLPYVRSKADGRRLTYCKKCRYVQYRQNATSTPIKFWNHRQKQLHRNCVKTGTDFDMPDNFLYQLWSNQDGKCFYTGEDMLMELTKGYRGNTASVDKIIPEHGYVVGNIVLCTARANSIKYDQTLDEMKLWMPEWYAKVEGFFNGN